jgi:hypothetical protein
VVAQTTGQGEYANVMVMMMISMIIITMTNMMASDWGF